jgi:hypothetical protein
MLYAQKRYLSSRIKVEVVQVLELLHLLSAPSILRDLVLSAVHHRKFGDYIKQTR